MKRWPLHKVWFWETAPFFRLLLPLAAGIYCYTVLRASLGDVVILTGISVSFALLLILGLLKQKSKPINYLFAVTTHAMIFFLALGWCYYNDTLNDNSWFGKKLHAQSYAVRIAEPPAEKARTWKLKVDVLNAIDSSTIQYVSGAAFVYVYKNGNDITLHEGDTILVPAKWVRITTAGNPFEFDYAAYCARHNIYYQQFVGGDELKVYAKANPGDLNIVRRIHNYSMQSLENFVSDKSALGLLQAMLIGDETNFDPELRQVYADTGIIHIVAISGSHITIFFVMVAFLLGWIKNKKYQWLKYVIAIPLVWTYVLVAGAPPSAVRASLMFTILAVGFALQKNPNSVNQLLATAFILLCAQPMWLFSVGFQLSFLAVLSLILFYRRIYLLLAPVHIVTKALWASVAASIAAEILIAPLVIYYFHIFPLMFIVANIAAYLFMGFVLVAGMAIIGTSFMPALASFISGLTSWAVSVFNALVIWLRQFNPESFYYLDLRLYELTLLYLAITTIAVHILRKQKVSLFIGLATLCMLMISFCVNEWKALHQQRLVVYNVGKANYIELIEGKYHRVIATDTAISEKNLAYAAKPAHTAWHAWREKIYKGNKELFQLKGSSVLMLNEAPEYDSAFPVDYVVVNYDSRKPIPEKLVQVFRPKKIILGSGVRRKRAAEWAAIYATKGIPLHNVQEDGAFVSDAFEALP